MTCLSCEESRKKTSKCEDTSPEAFICKTLGYFSLPAVSAFSWDRYIQSAVKWSSCFSTYFHTTLFFANLLADGAFVQWLIQVSRWYSFADSLISLESQKKKPFNCLFSNISVSLIDQPELSTPLLYFSGVGIISSKFILLFKYSPAWIARSHFSC